MQGTGHYFVAERQWELSDVQEKRMLLIAAIERVVVMPLAPDPLTTADADEWLDRSCSMLYSRGHGG
jgi:hypothetical protein